MRPLSSTPLLFAISFGSLASLAMAGCASPHAQTFTQVSGDDGGGDTVLLPYPSDGGVVEWDGWAGEFVADYCVQCHSPSASCFGSGCHTPGDPRTPDFHQKAAIVEDALLIRCGIAVEQAADWDCGATAPETFPVSNGSNPVPTDEQRAIVVGWIDAGCP